MSSVKLTQKATIYFKTLIGWFKYTLILVFIFFIYVSIKKTLLFKTGNVKSNVGSGGGGIET